MRRTLLITLLALLATIRTSAQEDSTAFRAYLYNKEYNVYLRIDFYRQDIQIPGQELYGNLPGYLGKKNNSFCWPVVSVEMTSPRKAQLRLVNDFGSEDLTATLTRQDDSTYVLRQLSGSTIKVPDKGKWVKLPKVLLFVKEP